jgi:hypothetical protein
MIPSTNNKLLVSEDWKKIYQSFRNADFQSYDFETLRRVMITYLQENYPEDFNDFIDSSEYIALVDLIAYLGQNLSFRIDLNARENFLETAQRRDSILRLAQLVSYVPKRNTPASGFLKIMSLSTTDNVIDSNGINLANVSVGWNDSTNSSWYQQFVTILNSAMPGSTVFGKPYDRKNIDGVLTEQYRIDSSNVDVPIFGFTKNINGTTMNFEVVPSTFSGKTSIYEESPRPGNTFSFIYKNDNQGYASINTGFFAHFRQGQIGTASFTIDNPVANEIIGVNTPDINNTDTWLWQLDGNGNYSTLWTQVPDVIGNNVIYNSLNKSERNVFSITTRDRDQVDLNFADGSFGNLPKGQFRFVYRQSNGLTYSIKPDQMSGIVVQMPYYNKAGQSHVLTMALSLQYTVNNSLSTESNASIQNKAPQAYYTQNRMVTAEDYNIAPLTLGSNIVKTKSVARVTSGVSKYFELSDVSGKYSNTNIFASDGILYKTSNELNFNFSSSNRNEIFSVIKQQLEPVVASTALRSFYLDNYSRPSLDGMLWNVPVVGQPRGYFSIDGIPVNVGSFSSNNLKYVTPGAMVKFVPPTGKYFTASGKLTSTPSSTTQNYLWAQVIQVIGDGSNSGIGASDDGTGPVILSNLIPDTAIPVEVIPKFVDVYTYTFESELVNLCLKQRNFGLTINKNTRQWDIILDTNLDLVNPFSLAHQGNIENLNKDASWLIAFYFTGKNYTVRHKLTNYIFESNQETAFFADSDTVNYDYTNNTVVKDKINVLSINTAPSSVSTGLNKDYQWQIDSAVVELDGYVDPKKVKVSFYDDDDSGHFQDPDAFNNIVAPNNLNFVFFKKLSDGLRYQLEDADIFTVAATPDAVIGTPSNGDLYYFYDPAYNVVKSYNSAPANPADPWVYEPDYFAYTGRSGLKFHYIHNSNENRRIDPSKSNIMDVYLLTKDYDTEYRSWLLFGSGAEPLAPTSASLEQNFSGALEPIKTISDEIVFQPVKYKALFGSMAATNLQATFKAVRNPTRPISDNELKSRILSAIEDFFALENWDFGQTFYFSELATYVMNLMTPDITNFVIVPKSDNNFGSLYEIACLSNELLISGATAADIEIIDALSASQLKTTSIVTTSGT